MKKITTIILTLLLILPLTACTNSKGESVATYTINATLNKDMTLSVSTTYDFTKKSSKNKSLTCFALYPNAFREDAKIKPLHAEYYAQAYPNGNSDGGIEIEEVYLNGAKTAFSIDGVDQNLLSIKSDDYKAGNNSITIQSKVKIPNVLHRFGYGENTINLTSFYPIALVEENGEFYENVYYPSGDPFYSECANYFVTLTVPSQYAVASSLKPTKTEVFGLNTKYSYQRNSVRDIAFVLSKNFKILTKNTNKVCVYYYYFNDQNPQKSLDTAVKSLNYYSENFSKYPYGEYVVCEADFIYGGMEYPCLTFIDEKLVGEDRDYCIAHETAHQWWYSIVGVNQIEEGYIDEGLTEYSTVRFLSDNSEYNTSKEELLKKVKNAYGEIRKIVAKTGGKSKPEMQRNLKDFSSDLDYVSIAYYRSQIMFFELENYMGKGKFNRFLKEILNKYSYKNINTAKMLEIAEKVKPGSKRFLQEYVSGISNAS